MQHDWFMYHLRSTYKNRLDFPFKVTLLGITFFYKMSSPIMDLKGIYYELQYDMSYNITPCWFCHEYQSRDDFVLFIP